MASEKQCEVHRGEPTRVRMMTAPSQSGWKYLDETSPRHMEIFDVGGKTTIRAINVQGGDLFIHLCGLPYIYVIIFRPINEQPFLTSQSARDLMLAIPPSKTFISSPNHPSHHAEPTIIKLYHLEYFTYHLSTSISYAVLPKLSGPRPAIPFPSAIDKGFRATQNFTAGLQMGLLE